MEYYLIDYLLSRLDAENTVKKGQALSICSVNKCIFLDDVVPTIVALEIQKKWKINKPEASRERFEVKLRLKLTLVWNTVFWKKRRKRKGILYKQRYRNEREIIVQNSDFKKSYFTSTYNKTFTYKITNFRINFNLKYHVYQEKILEFRASSFLQACKKLKTF